MARLNDLLRSHESSARLSLDQISQLESDLEKTRSLLAEAQEAGTKKVQVRLHSLSIAWHSRYIAMAKGCPASGESQGLFNMRCINGHTAKLHHWVSESHSLLGIVFSDLCKIESIRSRPVECIKNLYYGKWKTPV